MVDLLDNKVDTKAGLIDPRHYRTVRPRYERQLSEGPRRQPPEDGEDRHNLPLPGAGAS